MPEVFRKYGFLFFFYSREHEPIHVHVEGEEGLVIYDLIDDDLFFARKKVRLKPAVFEKSRKLLLTTSRKSLMLGKNILEMNKI